MNNSDSSQYLDLLRKEFLSELEPDFSESELFFPIERNAFEQQFYKKYPKYFKYITKLNGYDFQYFYILLGAAYYSFDHREQGVMLSVAIKECPEIFSRAKKSSQPLYRVIGLNKDNLLQLLNHSIKSGLDNVVSWSESLGFTREWLDCCKGNLVSAIFRSNIIPRYQLLSLIEEGVGMKTEQEVMCLSTDLILDDVIEWYNECGQEISLFEVFDIYRYGYA